MQHISSLSHPQLFGRWIFFMHCLGGFRIIIKLLCSPWREKTGGAPENAQQLFGPACVAWRLSLSLSSLSPSLAPSLSLSLSLYLCTKCDRGATLTAHYLMSSHWAAAGGGWEACRRPAVSSGGERWRRLPVWVSPHIQAAAFFHPHLFYHCRWSLEVSIKNDAHALHLE